MRDNIQVPQGFDPVVTEHEFPGGWATLYNDVDFAIVVIEPGDWTHYEFSVRNGARVEGLLLRDEAVFDKKVLNVFFKETPDLLERTELHKYPMAKDMVRTNPWTIQAMMKALFLVWRENNGKRY